ncbi:GYD domain-containing protein [Ralstonia solanacearum]|uniref:GYD domain-containing protein n=1 Tax=Ralstonia solanacearum K60 TaxID=1091042 RepID=A0AAP7ZMK3_RALSL|nr:GYD domain-containing protein [Ralstonia solanacearum]AST30835.1 GYD domain-containing protein [Ralstonia solanacearum]MBT1536566.1 GYD domain-containing protein [Ralstonia solanacearum]MBT1536723.1 GYD domain-containing protein [Ralstonia solanacearum]MDB0510640.1 GYD domain-containing protein [Ralstonia solanacearum]MDB0515626.1 GYD domain-containing protein [Ralstonia solanacearum]
MATFLALLNFTDQGIRSVKDTTKRAAAARELAKTFGIEMKDIYWTLGQYDLAAIFEGPDDATMTAFSLALGTAGNVRSETLRAFPMDEMNQILSKMP